MCSPPFSKLADLPVLDQNQGKSVVSLLKKEGAKDKPFFLSRWQKSDSGLHLLIVADLWKYKEVEYKVK